MKSLALLLALPLLYWQQGIETAPALKAAGIERLAVPPAQAAAWREAGFAAEPVEWSTRELLQTPRIVGRANVASATRRPWLDANGWRFVRNPAGRFAYDLPLGKAALAVAEAFAYNADAVLLIDPSDLVEFGKLLAWLRLTPELELSTIADIGLVDDGSPLVGEVMNLLARRNLLFRLVIAPSPQLALNIQLGSQEFPREAAADPSEFALRVRRQLTDERRSLRIYGTELVLARLLGNSRSARLHLINYSGREVEGLRVRVRGAYAKGAAKVMGVERATLDDYVVDGGATEFTLARMGVYAVIDLSALK